MQIYCKKISIISLLKTDLSTRVKSNVFYPVFVRKEGTKTVTVTETVHSAKVDHKFNARAKPFGASSPPTQTPQPSVPVAVHSSPAGNTSWQPPTFQAQRAPVAKTGPAGLSGPPTPPPPPNPATYAR